MKKNTALDLNLLRILKKISTNFNMFKLFFHQRYFIIRSLWHVLPVSRSEWMNDTVRYLLGTGVASYELRWYR